MPCIIGMITASTKINVKGTEIAVIQREDEDYTSLTDIAKSRNAEHPDDLIRNWLRNRNTLELLGIWEQLHNPDFNPVEFDGIKKLARLNSFTLTPKQWIEKTGAVGIASKAGRYGGTYAHRNVAFEFASWVSVEFKLYLIKEFQRLKEDENRRLSLAWNLNRTLAKINYRIHTDAIQSHLLERKTARSWRAINFATLDRKCPTSGNPASSTSPPASARPPASRWPSYAFSSSQTPFARLHPLTVTALIQRRPITRSYSS